MIVVYIKLLKGIKQQWSNNVTTFNIYFQFYSSGVFKTPLNKQLKVNIKSNIPSI